MCEAGQLSRKYFAFANILRKKLGSKPHSRESHRCVECGQLTISARCVETAWERLASVDA